LNRPHWENTSTFL